MLCGAGQWEGLDEATRNHWVESLELGAIEPVEVPSLPPRTKEEVGVDVHFHMPLIVEVVLCAQHDEFAQYWPIVFHLTAPHPSEVPLDPSEYPAMARHLHAACMDALHSPGLAGHTTADLFVYFVFAHLPQQAQ